MAPWAKKIWEKPEASPKSVVFFAQGEQHFFAVLSCYFFLLTVFFLAGFFAAAFFTGAFLAAGFFLTGIRSPPFHSQLRKSVKIM
ncbi:MAG TPA: hypothetical protein VIT00_07030 [Terrimicrobiaceae bacterium]